VKLSKLYFVKDTQPQYLEEDGHIYTTIMNFIQETVLLYI